jgi:proton glutamate symport protein
VEMANATHSGEVRTEVKPKALSPYLILGALTAGIAFGWLCPEWAQSMKRLGDGFIKLIKMIIVPLVFSTLVMGIAGGGDFKQVSRMALKALLWFTFASTIAMALGLVLADVLQPGIGVHQIAVPPLDAAGKELHAKSTVEVLLSIIPDNIFASLSEGNLLQVVFFACFLGIVLTAAGERGKPILALSASVADAMFRMTNYIVKISPIAVFALIGWSVGRYGLEVLLKLGQLVMTIYLGLFLFIAIILVPACAAIGINFLKLMRVIKDPLVLAFTTCSSEAALPALMERLENFGVPRHIVSFVLPTGYSFNLDGASVYKCMAMMFVAQMYHIEMPLQTQLSMLGLMLILQKGSAGVPGAALVTLLAGFKAFDLPLEGLAMIMSVDRIIEMGRTATNVIGNSVATLLVARWEGALPREAVARGHAVAETG